jgi:hypothetical protein
MSYERGRRQGRTKSLEASGNWKGLLEHMIKLSEAHQDHATAAELREQLNKPTITTVVEAEPEPPKAVRIPKRRARYSPPLSLSREEARRLAWEDMMRKYRD